MTTMILTHGRVTWTNILHPTQEDLQQLAARYPHIHPINLHNCETELEFPKLDHYDEYVFLVIQLPVWDAAKRLYVPAEVDIFLAQGVLVTSHRGELPWLMEHFGQLQADEALRAEWMSQGASPLLCRLLDTLVEDNFTLVREISDTLRAIEEKMFRDDSRVLLQEVAEARREIIALLSILKLQPNVISALTRGSWPFIHEDLGPYWNDINDHLALLCAMLDEYAEVVTGLSETLDTLASHRIDEVVRLLTIVTVLTLPITLLATIFGMNVAMPYAEHPVLFYLLVGLGVGLTGGLIWYLRRQRWL